jgi:hypothetical protein
MTKYTKYMRKHDGVVVKALHFNAKDPRLWPSMLVPWTASGLPQPIDMSWGYIERPFGRIHVLHDDWIVKYPDGQIASYKPQAFNNTFKKLEE